MIKGFAHDGLEGLYRTGTTKGVQQDHVKKLRRILTTLDEASKPSDMGLPGYNLHPLEPKKDGIWSVKVNGNWRVTFRFEDDDVVLVDYRDYH